MKYFITIFSDCSKEHKFSDLDAAGHFSRTFNYFVPLIFSAIHNLLNEYEIVQNVTSNNREACQHLDSSLIQFMCSHINVKEKKNSAILNNI